MKMDMTAMPIRSMAPAIEKRLRKVFPAKRFVIERTQPTMTVDDFNRYTRQAPFIGLAFCGQETDPNAGEFLQANWNWKLVIICKASGGFDRKVKGDAFDIGLDDIMDVACVILHGFTFPDIGLCTVGRSAVIYNEGSDKNAEILAHVDFTIRTTATVGALELETPEDFAGIGANWMLSEPTNNGEE